MSVSPRLFIDGPIDPAHDMALPAGPARHVRQALRLKPGASLVLFDGTGGEWSARLERFEGVAVLVRAHGFRAVERESPLSVRLVQGISRGERMDFTVQKAVELGVAEIVPVLTAHGVVRLDPARAARRVTHWQGIAAHACEQCGRNRLPAIADVGTLDAWLAHDEGPGTKLMLDPDVGRGLAELPPPVGTITLAVGPEGGISPQEKAQMVSHGYVPIALGPRVLRTETAGVAALAALQVLWGDLG